MIPIKLCFKQTVTTLLIVCFALAICCVAGDAQTNRLPHLRKQGVATQLIVDDKPFLVLAGELGKSTSSNLEYMRPIWPKLAALKLNTVLVPVYWELVEPTEGKFDFTLVDGLVLHTTTIVGSVQMPVNKPEAADQPAPRADRNSMLAHSELLEKAKHGRIDVYFEGDSITRRWGTSDEQYKHFLQNWQQNFFGWNAANFGWGGDRTQNILWRLNNGELDNVKPKIIVLLAGTNNVGNTSPESSDDPRRDIRVGEVTRGIKAILDVCHQKAPSATIVLMGIFPRNDNMLVMPIINEINRRIAKFGTGNKSGKKIRFLNINNKLADRDGRLLEGMATKDGLHLDLKGYQVWADALKPVFTELLGPPAKEDHAPPPTGDPSVKNLQRPG
jgi:lysophospholipase L1-like esterase